MKSLFKLLVALAALAGVCYLIFSRLDQDDDPDYISIYGGPEDTGDDQ